jgi:hypothetical protein
MFAFLFDQSIDIRNSATNGIGIPSRAALPDVAVPAVMMVPLALPAGTDRRADVTNQDIGITYAILANRLLGQLQVSASHIYNLDIVLCSERVEQVDGTLIRWPAAVGQQCAVKISCKDFHIVAP